LSAGAEIFDSRSSGGEAILKLAGRPMEDSHTTRAVN